MYCVQRPSFQYSLAFVRIGKFEFWRVVLVLDRRERELRAKMFCVRFVFVVFFVWQTAFVKKTLWHFKKSDRSRLSVWPRGHLSPQLPRRLHLQRAQAKEHPQGALKGKEELAKAGTHWHTFKNAGNVCAFLKNSRGYLTFHKILEFWLEFP